MTLLDSYALLKQGIPWSANGRCKGYAVSNPGESTKIDAYVAALAAGQRPTPPVLATDTGRGLVGIMASLAAAAPPPPPPPPPPPSSFTVAVTGIPARGQTLKATVTP